MVQRRVLFRLAASRKTEVTTLDRGVQVARDLLRGDTLTNQIIQQRYGVSNSTAHRYMQAVIEILDPEISFDDKRRMQLKARK
mgnify:FL=1